MAKAKKGKTNQEVMDAAQSSKSTSDLAKKMGSTRSARQEQFGKPKVRTLDELMKGNAKERSFGLIREAYNLAKKNGFTGTVLSEYTPKAVNGAFYNASRQSYTGKSAPYWRLDENSSEFQNIRSLARAAQADVASGSYTSSVKELLNAFMALGGGTGEKGSRGPRNRDLSKLAAVEI